MKKCTEEDLAQFYPSKEKFEWLAEKTKDFMYCPDYSNLVLQGGFHSAYFRRPMISFSIPLKYCRNDTNDRECIVSKEYEETWENKFIVMLTNQKRFDQLEYYSNPVIEESIFTYLEFPTTNKADNFSIKRSKVELEDNLLVTLEDINTQEQEFFEIS